MGKGKKKRKKDKKSKKGKKSDVDVGEPFTLDNELYFAQPPSGLVGIVVWKYDEESEDWSVVDTTPGGSRLPFAKRARLLKCAREAIELPSREAAAKSVKAMTEEVNLLAEIFGDDGVQLEGTITTGPFRGSETITGGAAVGTTLGSTEVSQTDRAENIVKRFEADTAPSLDPKMAALYDLTDRLLQGDPVAMARVWGDMNCPHPEHKKEAPTAAVENTAPDLAYTIPELWKDQEKLPKDPDTSMPILPLPTGPVSGSLPQSHDPCPRPQLPEAPQKPSVYTINPVVQVVGLLVALLLGPIAMVLATPVIVLLIVVAAIAAVVAYFVLFKEDDTPRI